MTPYSRSFGSLVALFTLAILFVFPGLVQASSGSGSGWGSGSGSSSDFTTFVADGVDEDTATCVAEFITEGTTAAELLSKDFRPDKVIKNDDGTVTHVYRQVRYVIERTRTGGELKVRLLNRLGTDLSVTLRDSIVTGWSLQNLK